MTEPSSGTPSPLPAEPAEPAAQDPAIATDKTLEAELGENGDIDEAEDGAAVEEGEEAASDELDFDEEEEEAEGGALEAEGAAVEGTVPEAIARPAGSAARRRAGVAPVVPHAPTQSELAVRVTDNQSRIFVIATVVVFVGILAFGIFGGVGGVLTPRPTPTPVPSLTAAPSASAGASESLAPSASPSAAASASPS